MSTVDLVGGLRVWTALDGSREPAPISAPVPTQIAIADTPNEVTLGLVDQAGSAHVLHLAFTIASSR